MVAYSLTPVVVGDFNGDLVINAADWIILRNNQLADLSGLSLNEAYQRGDLTGDYRNDHADFTRFKSIFDGQNGVGAFATMAAQVPEPSAAALVVLAIVGGLARRRRQTS
jgi:hypothetical protein